MKIDLLYYQKHCKLRLKIDTAENVFPYKLLFN